MGVLGTHLLRCTLQHSVSDNANAASEVTTTTTVVSARSRSRTARRWLTAVLGAGSILGATSHDAAAFPATACLLSAAATNCTANDGSIGAVALNRRSLPGVNPSSCILGSTITIDLLVSLGEIQASNRFNIGFYVARDGKSLVVAPPTGAATCSVGTTPVPPGPFHRRSTARFQPPGSKAFGRTSTAMPAATSTRTSAGWKPGLGRADRPGPGAVHRRRGRQPRRLRRALVSAERPPATRRPPTCNPARRRSATRRRSR